MRRAKHRQSLSQALYLMLMALLCLGPLWSCMPKKNFREAEQATEQRQWDQAYKLWEQVLVERPNDVQARIQKERVGLQAGLTHLKQANYYFGMGKLNDADFEAGLVLVYDPANQIAKDLKERIIKQRERKRREAAEREDRVRGTGIDNVPLLKPKTWEPLNMYFPKPTDIRDIYSAMGKAYGINILVDPKLRTAKMPLDLRGLNFIKSLEALMILNKHFYKVLDERTIIILEDAKQVREKYENQIIKTFYLSNITPNDLKAHLRTLGQFKEFAENNELNAITIKGTPEQIALAEKIIASNDKSRAEVLIEVELLEVNKNAMRNIGMLPVGPGLNNQPLYQAFVGASPRDRDDDAEDSNALRGIFPSLNSDDFLTIVPSVAINFLKEHGDSKQVSNPRIRVTAGEEAKVVIGQRIPTASTSFTNAQLSNSGNSNNFGDQALTTFTYNDVGIGISVKPRVHHNSEITLELDLEVTSVLSQGLQPIFGQRKVKTVNRLGNGETTVLFGLLTNEERKSLTGIAGLSDIPILGRLFSNDDKVISQTDIILTMRPVIVRGPNITAEDVAPYEVSNLRLSSMSDQHKAEKETASEDGIEDETPRDEEPPGNPPSEDPYDVPSGSYEDVAYEEESPGEAPPSEVSGSYEDEAPADELEPPPAEAIEEEAVPAMLAFTPPNLTARQDERLDYQLFIANVESMKRGEIVMTFDPKVLQVEDITLGNYWDPNERRPLITPAWNNVNGRISIALTQYGETTFSGSGILAGVSFRAKATGSGALELESITLINHENKHIPTEGLAGLYEVLP